jgi:putative Holliday junction resolvase
VTEPSATPDIAVTFPLLGLDISDRRIGVAIAGGLPVAPRPVCTYLRTTRADDLARCVAWVAEFGCAGVVIGLPLNMDGTAGDRAVWMRRFARHLGAMLAVPVWLQDERLTTVEAEEILQERGLRRNERAAQVDALAAALILERFLQEHA